ncbi:MAG TPA: triphosphoribosyl-dephospho-CoA synthase [Pseudolabrys sp.]|nr:triphosphoribosyl-dephospho-CoA synthase [Pseudolabrys sp.]
MTASPQEIAAVFIAACRDELEAPKPGNVHVFADGHRMTTRDFERSALAAVGPLTAPGKVGARILGAIEATAAAVGANTNLGIVLLCAPLAAAAGRAQSAQDLRASLANVLAELDIEDAGLAFRAIVQASPAGLGHAARHDVSAPPTVTLRAAMAEAAARDRIAQQYVSDFADIFEAGARALDEARRRSADPRMATLQVYLGFLAAFPDSHIARKHGADVAEAVRSEAAVLRARMVGGIDDVLPALMQWDTALKSKAINPGTSADLTVATLFADRLHDILPVARNSG